MNSKPHTTRLSRPARSAFTLVEVMISIALALVLMVGINSIFKMTGDAVGASQSISEQVRNARSAQTVMAADFKRLASDAPLVINMQTQPAFRNAAEKAADLDGNPRTIDLDGNGIEGEATVPGEIISATNFGTNNYRVDTISFFARGRFDRQTGGNEAGTSPLIADMSTNEAYIWFGHLRLLTNAATGYAFDPAEADTGSEKNDNNRYASQFVLGRAQMCLATPDASGKIFDRAGNAQSFIERRSQVAFPMGWSAIQTTPPNPKDATTEKFRYDLCNGSIADANDSVDTVVNNPASYNDKWWEMLFGKTTYLGASATGKRLRRFESSSYLPRPATAGNPLIDAAAFAKMQPSFVPGCAQFIVEYAGDFVAQNDDGDVTNVFPFPANTATGDPGGGTGTDGVTDYVVINRGTTNAYRQVRWYGLPRNIPIDPATDDGKIAQNVSPTAAGTPGSPDVIPLMDLIRTRIPGTIGAPFEKFWPSEIRPGGIRNTGNYAVDMTSTDYYTCAFTAGDRKPTMIRITMVLDDPLGRLNSGQTFEFIYKLDVAND